MKYLFDFSPFIESEISKYLTNCLNTGVIKSCDVSYKTTKNISLSLYLIPVFNNESKIIQIQVIMQNINIHKETEEKLKYLLKLEETLSKISSFFVSSISIDLTYILQILGDTFSANRGYIYFFTSDYEKMIRTHEWYDNKTGPLPMDTREDSVSKYPWFLKKLKENKIVIVHDVEQLTDEAAAEREALKLTGIKSVITAPIISKENKLIGYFTLTSSEKLYSHLLEEERVLKVVSEIISTYLERNQADAKISNIARELRQFIDNSNSPIFCVDKEGKIIEWNCSSEKITGFKLEEVYQKELALFVTKDNRTALREMIKNSINGIETSNFEFPISLKENEKVMILLNSTIRHDVDGNIIGVWLVGQNVTNLLEYQESLKQKVEERTSELKEALDKEKELSELKSKFVSTVSHEFRTPLSAILASSSILRIYSDKLTPEQSIQRLNKIEVQVKHMTKMLYDVLIIGKIEAGKLECNLEFINLKLLCEDIIQEIKVNYENKCNIMFQYNASVTWVCLDERLIKKIINNLLDNAIKFSDSGGIVNFVVSYADEKINFYIQDKGIGIPEESINDIFEPFYRAKNVGAIQGTGLGLSIVKTSVELHGGSVKIISTPITGTTINVIIPI